MARLRVDDDSILEWEERFGVERRDNGEYFVVDYNPKPAKLSVERMEELGIRVYIGSKKVPVSYLPEVNVFEFEEYGPYDYTEAMAVAKLLNEVEK